MVDFGSLFFLISAQGRCTGHLRMSIWPDRVGVRIDGQSQLTEGGEARAKETVRMSICLSCSDQLREDKKCKIRPTTLNTV